MPEGSRVYMSLHFSSGLAREINLGLDSLCMKFKELDREEMSGGKVRLKECSSGQNSTTCRDETRERGVLEAFGSA